MKDIFIDGPISPAFIAESIQRHNSKKDIGAHSIFLGQVRADIIDDKKVAAIDYTSYREMALEQMQEIREVVFAEFEINCMHVYHSLGKVNAGGICLFVFTSSAHRKAATDACEKTVELIKKELAVWGREIFDDETHQWKENK